LQANFFLIRLKTTNQTIDPTHQNGLTQKLAFDKRFLKFGSSTLL